MRTRVALAGIAVVAGVLSASCSSGESAQSEVPVAVAAPLAGVAPRSGDSDFIGALGGRVHSVTSSVAAGMGMRACSAFSEGSTAADIRQVLVQKGLDEAEASRVVLAAVSTYCPEYADRAMG